MIFHLNKNISKNAAEALAARYQGKLFENGKMVLVTSSKMKSPSEELKDASTEFFVTDTDIQLSSSQYLGGKRSIAVGDVVFGGNSNISQIITGPCSVESEEQIEAAAQFCVGQGIRFLRAGAYKPRTSPYTFQGLGLEGLKLLHKMRSKYGLKIVTEVRDSTHVDEVIEYADIIQIGAKSMYDHGILQRCGQTRKAVLLKRGFGSTLQEFVQSAEFILSGGNPNVMLCERGIRTFETKTRFTLDLCGVAWLKQNTNLPIVLDPSHAIGYAYGVPDLARACVAMGVDGMLIETHPNPAQAKSDAEQQLSFEQFKALYSSLKKVGEAVGVKVI